MATVYFLLPCRIRFIKAYLHHRKRQAVASFLGTRHCQAALVGRTKGGLMMKKILIIAALGASVAFGQASVENITWKLTTLNGTSVGTQAYTIKFSPDGSAGGTVDCNTCGWSYTVTGLSISIQPGMCTMMACGDESRDNEYLTMLGNVNSYSLNGAYLYLSKSGSTLAVFTNGQQASLTGTSWQLQSIRQTTGRTVIATPADYTANFQASGKAAIRADCNTCNGNYTADASVGTLDVSGISCTKMFCGAGSKDQAYLAVLDKVTAYAIMGDTLFCYGSKDTLVFKPAAATVVGPDAISNAAAENARPLNVSVNGHILRADACGRPIVSVRLLTISGACVRSGHSAGGSITIDASGLPVGMYLLQATLSTGAQLMRRVELVR
jgi:heat shock protein HslJ